MTVRRGVGVFDVSHMGEFTIKGPNALDLIQRVTSNDASKLIEGQAQYSCLPNEDGGIIDDLFVCCAGTKSCWCVAKINEDGFIIYQILSLRCWRIRGGERCDHEQHRLHRRWWF